MSRCFVNPYQLQTGGSRHVLVAAEPIGRRPLVDFCAAGIELAEIAHTDGIGGAGLYAERLFHTVVNRMISSGRWILDARL